MNEYNIFEKNELHEFINYTKGKINYIFKFITKENIKIYLIKTKILKDIIDNDLQFKNFNELINYLYSLEKPKVNYINIAFCLSNFYSTLAYVSMISILSNKKYYTYISFYLIIPNNFIQKNIDFIKSLNENYDFFNITFIKMDNRYKNAFISSYITNEAYYRFSLGELLPNINKIIYLDPDTITYKDLTNFYSINFNGKIILGQATIGNKSTKTSINKINSGILLLNLKGMRKIKMEKKVLYLINHGFKARYHDQTLINKYLYKYVGFFPPEYHTRCLNQYKNIKIYNRMFGNLYDNDILYFTWKYPTIRHYLGKYKPMNNKYINADDWWYYARKSKYFKKITNNLTNIFNFTL